MSGLRVLVESDLEVGKPLRWPVCDHTGRVLVKPGLVLSTDAQREHLLSKRLYVRVAPDRHVAAAGHTAGANRADDTPPCAPDTTNESSPFHAQEGSTQAEHLSDLSLPASIQLPENPALSEQALSEHALSEQAQPEKVARASALATPFQLIDQLSNDWETVAARLKSDDEQRHIAVPGVVELAHNIQNLVRRHVSPVLAALQLNGDRDYALTKSLHVAAICELLGKRVGLTENERLSLICAALTYDLGMVDTGLQDQAEPLSDQQKRDIRDHPEKGRQLLFSAGVRDSLWLTAVLQHHERSDGSGYPEGVRGQAISLPARVLAITDTYCAMVRPRGDRAEVVAKDVLEEFFQARAASIDPEMVAHFTSELGVYPPGSVVRLACGELAVVTERGKDPSQPQVDTICLAGDQQLERSLPRDSHNPSYRVAEIESRPEQIDMAVVLSDVWRAIPFDILKPLS